MNEIIKKYKKDIKTLYGWAILLSCVAIDSKWLLNKIPPERLIKKPNKTHRYRYELERGVYRSAMRLVRRGDPLDTRNYYIYSLIAKKYNWPYIKETYDKS